MAESIFNQMNLAGFRAISAGTNPAKKANPLVVEALRENGIEDASGKPLDEIRTIRDIICQRVRTLVRDLQPHSNGSSDAGKQRPCS